MTALHPSKPSTEAAALIVDGAAGWVAQFGRDGAVEEAASIVEQQTHAGRLASDLAVLEKEYRWQINRLAKMLDGGRVDEARAALRRMKEEGNHALVAARRTLKEVGYARDAKD